MRLLLPLAIVVAAWILLLPGPGPRVITLPAGVIELHYEWTLSGGVEVRGAAAGTVLRASADFDGRALLVVHGAGVTLRGFTIDGNRLPMEFQNLFDTAKPAFHAASK